MYGGQARILRPVICDRCGETRMEWVSCAQPVKATCDSCRLLSASTTTEPPALPVQSKGKDKGQP